MYLEDEEIVSIIIENILDDRYNQAILIDGVWGSGKTYFVENILIKGLKNKFCVKNQEERKIIYISLYGFQELEQINNEIYTSVIEDMVEAKINKSDSESIKKGINLISKITTTGLKFINTDKIELPQLSDFMKLKKCVIIFDDLERCNIDVNEIFGYLNNLVEHNDVKIVIIANQSEIGRLKLADDLPLKYLVALNKNLKIGDMNNNNERAIDEEMLKQYTEKIFSQDIMYERIKEKLIGITINYRTDLNNIFPKIVDQYFNSSKVGKYLFEESNFIISIFQENQHYNLRTLIFALMSFEKFSIVLDKMNNEKSEYINIHKKRILEYCLKLSIRLKSGKKAYPWKNNSIEADIVYFGNEQLKENSCYGYKFVDDYLLYRQFNEKAVIDLIKKLISEEKESDDFKVFQSCLHLHQLDNWWELEDEKILEYLDEILRELGEEKYHAKYFKAIITLLMRLEYFGFKKMNYSAYIVTMEKILTTSEDELKASTLEVVSTDNDFRDKYTELIRPLISILENKEKIKDSEINEIFEKENWGLEFYEYCEKNWSVFINKKKFLCDIEIEEVIRKIENADLKNLHGFLSGIKEVYKSSNFGDFFKADEENLSELISLIEEKQDDIINGKVTRRIYFEKLLKKLRESLILIIESEWI